MYSGYINEEGERHGPGTLAWRKLNKRTDQYEVEYDEGRWKNDVLDGKICIKKRVGIKKYVGAIKNGMRHGEGC